MYISFKLKSLVAFLALLTCYGATCQQADLKSIQENLEKGEYDISLMSLQLIDTSVLDPNQKIDYLLLLGDAYLHLGRNDKALSTLKIVETQIGKSNSLNASSCFEDLGIVYWNNGNKTTALSYHEKALKIREQLLSNKHVKIADSYNNIGLIYLEDEYLQAIFYFNKALDIYTEQLGATAPKVALVYSNLAFAYSAQGNYDDAIRYLDEVIKIWNTTYEENHPNKAYALSNKGLIYFQQENFEQAQVFQLEALEMYKSLHGVKHPEIANTYFLLGNIALKQNRFANAADLYQKSIYANLPDQNSPSRYDHPTMEGFLNADILLSSLQAKAKALEALHFEKTLKPRDLTAALETYNLADQLISKIRQLRQNEADKLKLSQLATTLYENAINLSVILSESTLKKEYYLREAFRYCERSKSAILLEAIAETNAKQFAGIPAQILAEEDGLKENINFLEQKLAEGKNEIGKLKNALFNYEQAYRQLIERIETEFPKYYDLKFNSSVASVPMLQGKLKAQEAILSYFVGDEKIYIFTVTSKKLIVTERLKPNNFLGLVNGYRNAIKYRIESVYKTQALNLYDLLIPDVNKQTKLNIIPAGILSTIPFEALVSTKNDQPLIKDYHISYDYSATLWFNRFTKTNKKEGGILLNAPISFDKNEVQLVTLPGTKKEILDIKYLFIGSETEPTVYLNEASSESQLKATLLSDYKYLHFATHGIVNESKPELSRIFLSPNQKEDGNLYSGEIYNLDMDVSLVTLSACETGLGKVEKGEGVMGLSRALMYAGAQNLIVSLWKVSDASTADLMIDFYSNLVHTSDIRSFAPALRQAKIKLLESEAYSAPYFWAPFVLVGK